MSGVKLDVNMATRDPQERLKSNEAEPSTFVEYSIDDLKNTPEFEHNQMDGLVGGLKDEKFRALYDLADQTGMEIYLTGGIIRDSLIGKEPKDHDFIVRFPPGTPNGQELFESFFGTKQKVESRRNHGKKKESEEDSWEFIGPYGKLKLVGTRFGVYKFHPRLPDGTISDEYIDIAFPRTEQAQAGSLGGRGEFEVQSDATLPISEDVSRRDFTVNALVMKISRQDGEIAATLQDYVQGIEDLKQRKLRAVGNNPHQRLREDLSRVWRAYRFEVAGGFTMVPELRAAVKEIVAGTRDGERALLKRRPDGSPVIAPEVSSKEFLKGFLKNPAVAIETLAELGMLPDALPDLYEYRPLNGEKDVDSEFHRQLRQENLTQTIETLRIYQAEHGEDANLDEYLFILFHKLGQSREFARPVQPGRKQNFKMEYRDRSSGMIDRIIDETRMDQFSTDSEYRIHDYRLKQMLKRHKVGVGLLSSKIYTGNDLPINEYQFRRQVMFAFPQFTRDPLLQILKADMQAGGANEESMQRLTMLENNLRRLEEMHAQLPGRFNEQILSGKDLQTTFFVRPSRIIEPLLAQAKARSFDAIDQQKNSDLEIKKKVLAGLYVDRMEDLRLEWRELISPDDLNALQISAEAGSEEGLRNQRRIQAAIVDALSRRICEKYLGISVDELAAEELAIRENLEKSKPKESFGDILANALAENPTKVLSWMEKSFEKNKTLSSILLPEVRTMVGCDQRGPYHQEGDVWKHTRLLFEQAQKNGFELTPELALALLLHDSGKPVTRVQKEGRTHFTNHERASGQIFHDLTDRLGMLTGSNIDLPEVDRVIRNHGNFYGKWQSGNINLIEIRQAFPNGLEDNLYKIMVCDAGASVPENPASKMTDEKLFEEIRSKIMLVEKEKQHPGEFERLITTPEIGALLHGNNAQQKMITMYEQFIGLVNGRVISVNELKWKFIRSNPKFTEEYVKTQLAPGRIFPAEISGIEIGLIQREIRDMIISGQDVEGQDVSDLLALKLEDKLTNQT